MKCVNEITNGDNTHGVVCVFPFSGGDILNNLIMKKKWVTLLDLCVSSLRRGHANLLCIVPILTDGNPEGNPTFKQTFDVREVAYM